jgi:uncharacterized protein (DUF1330 family)
MAVLLAEYKVKDLEVFMSVFEEFQPTRAEHGAIRHSVLRSADDATIVNVLISFPSVAQARAFADDPRRAGALSRAGVIERADEVMEDVETRTY